MSLDQWQIPRTPGSSVCPDLTLASVKFSTPGACCCCPQVWSKSFSLSNYNPLHLLSLWFAVFCKASEAPLAIITRRARPKQTSGAIVSLMNSHRNFAVYSPFYQSWNPLDSCLPSLYSSPTLYLYCTPLMHLSSCKHCIFSLWIALFFASYLWAGSRDVPCSNGCNGS